MSQTGRQQVVHPHGYVHGDDDCRHCDLQLLVDEANVEEFVEQDLSKDKDGGDTEPDYLHSAGTACDPEVYVGARSTTRSL